MCKPRPSLRQTPAEALILHALDWARRQGAKSLALRAAMRLGRLWSQQGKQAEARQVLSEICVWFTKGLDSINQ